MCATMGSDIRWFAALDFEATCWDTDRAKQRREAEIIEFPTVLYRVVGDGRNSHLERVGEWRAFVRPTLNPTLSPFCVQLTGISQAQVDAAQPLVDVLPAHAEWLHAAVGGADQACVIFVTCGDYDLGTALPLELRNKGLTAPAVYARWVNLKREFATALRIAGRPPDMTGMLRAAGLPLEGRHHSGLDDSRNIGRCLEAVWSKGHRRFEVRTARSDEAAVEAPAGAH